MMQRISIIAVILITGCSTTAPKSRVAAPAPAIQYLSGNGPFTFDCDAAAGMSDSRNIRIPSGNLKVTGQIEILTARRDVVWEASAGMELVDPTRRDAAALQVLVRYLEPNKVNIAFGTASSAPDNNVFASMPFSSEPFAFSLTVDQSGTISGSFGGVTSPQPLHFSGATLLAIGCSTAHVRFSNVRVGDAGQSGSDDPSARTRVAALQVR